MACSIMLWNSCEKLDPLNEVDLIVDANLIKTTVNIMFVDAKTREPIGFGTDKVIQVTVHGANRDDVVDVTGIQKEVYRTAGGFVGVGLEPDVVPTEANPVNFTLVAHTSGYFSTSVPVVLGQESHETLEVPMVAYDNPPEGVTIATRINTTAVGGVIQTEATVVTPVVAATNTKAEVIIPEGITMTDADGNPLQGEIKTRVGYFSNVGDASLQAFPGGLTTNVNDGGLQEEINFFSAGFVAIEITDENGRAAKNFSGGTVQLSVEIAADTYNPDTEMPVQPGDIIPLWSYDEETGEWFKESEVAISGPLPNGNLLATGQLEHLSYWNWDWKWGWVCWWGAQLGLRSNEFTGWFSGRIYAYRVWDNALLKCSFIRDFVGDNIRLLRVPGGMPVRFEIYDLCGGLMGSTVVNNLCDGGLHPIDLAAPCGGGNVLQPVNIRLSGICENRPGVVIRPSTVFWYYNMNRNIWSVGFLTNGLATVNVFVGEPYLVAVYHNNQLYQYQVTPSSTDDVILENILLTAAQCNQL